MILCLLPSLLSVGGADIRSAGWACGPVNLRFLFDPGCPVGPPSATDPAGSVGPLLVLFGPIPRLIKAGLWSYIL